jgi:hypothetical protein
MRFGFLAVTIATLATCLTSTACAPSVRDGAQRIYSVAEICPYDSVTATERSDLAPHTVLKSAPTPPGTNIDSIASTYQVSGCGKKALYVCARPVVGNHTDAFSVAVSAPADDGPHLVINTPYFTETRAIDVDGDRIANMAVCEPAPPQ